MSTVEDALRSRGIRISTEDVVLVADAMVHGQKIAAIKKLREFTNLGLIESKDVIDRCPGMGGPLTLADRPRIVETLKKNLHEMFPTACQWDVTAVLLDENTIEAMIAVQMAVLAELKEMNELLRDVMEGME